MLLALKNFHQCSVTTFKHSILSQLFIILSFITSNYSISLRFISLTRAPSHSDIALPYHILLRLFLFFLFRIIVPLIVRKYCSGSLFQIIVLNYHSPLLTFCKLWWPTSPHKPPTHLQTAKKKVPAHIKALGCEFPIDYFLVNKHF